MNCLGFAAMVMWLLGYPDQASRLNAELLTMAQNVSDPFSLAYALTMAGRLLVFRREWHLVQEQAEAILALSTEHGFTFNLAVGMTMRACALVMQDPTRERIAQIHQSFATRRMAGMRSVLPWLALLAEAHGEARQAGEGLTVLRESLAYIDQTEERWYEAELHRLKGELLLLQSMDNQLETESCFHQALNISRHQQAKSLELRTATSLARLWQSQGNRDEARELLDPVYSWFTEGFDTADLIDAKTLLDELA